MDILSRLPITSLLTSRCVCKDWIRLFQEPYFIKLQLAASPSHFLTHDEEDGTTFQFGQILAHECTQDLEERTVNLHRLTLPVRAEQFECINSCNRLLCFLEDDPKPRGCVCNQILGEWVSISTPARNYSINPTIMALLFCAKNNQYKLLHGFITTVEQGDHLRFQIYTLGGTGQWRSIDETLTRSPRGFFDYEYDHLVLHGSVHWIDHDTLTIYCFDVDDEKFRRLQLLSPEGKYSDFQKLEVINGCLCVQLCYEHEDSCRIDKVEIVLLMT